MCKETLNTIALALAVMVSASLLALFHNRFWWPPDEGFAAHLAERLLRGEVISRDFHPFHSGYTIFVHALALKLFGKDLVSLRFPLMAISFVQALLVCFLFPWSHRWLAVVASIASVALGVLHFLGPDSKWYCLFLVIVLTVLLSRDWGNQDLQIVTAGFLVVSIYLFRQLSGLLVGIGVMSYLLFRYQEKALSREHTYGGKLLTLVFLAGLIVYLKRATDWFGLFLIGVWPLLILILLLLRLKISNKRLMHILKSFSVGAMLASLPMLAYLLWHGALGAWFNDTVLRASSILGKEYLHMYSYQSLLTESFNGAISLRSFSGFLNGVYWLTILMIFGVCGFLVFRNILTNKNVPFLPDFAFPFIAVFYAVVSLHNQIPIYIYFTIGFSTAALLWLTTKINKKLAISCAVVTAWLCVMGVYFHAGQPVSRGLEGYISGKRIDLVPAAQGLKFVGLWIERADVELYSRLIPLIERESKLGEKIFVLPYNPEIYFLSERENPFRSAIFDLEVTNEKEYSHLTTSLKKGFPHLVIWNPWDKRNTPFAILAGKFIEENYRLIEEIGRFRIYKYVSKE